MSAFQVFTRLFAVVSEWAHKEGYDSYGDYNRVRSSLILTSRATPPALVMVINLEKSDLKLSSTTQYLGMLIDTIRERAFPTDFHILGFGRQVPSVKMWQQLLGYVASLLQFVHRMHSLQWHLKTFWFAALDDLAKSVPFPKECKYCICWWLQEER